MSLAAEAPEPAIERALRRRRWVVPAVTLGTTAALMAAIWACMLAWRAGHGWIAIASGLFAHAVMVVAVHDGAHGAVTRTAFDRLLCSIVSGLLLLPFYGEAFRRYHLLHHTHANGPHDPLYLPSKARLFARNRLLYMALDVVPMLLSFVCRQTQTSPDIKVPAIRLRFVAVGLVVAGCVVLAARPPLGFVVATIVSLYTWASIRDWCEHWGTEDGRVANAYWFPLGMGIGNHDAHHRWPHHSWITMSLGLWQRKKDTHPLRAALEMATNPAFRHYVATASTEEEGE
jgi:fatty acid desaturase